MILIVDDNTVNLLLLETHLFLMGERFKCVKSGEEAISAVRINPGIKLIIMDLVMPKMNGYEATEIIKSMSPIPVIAHTGFSRQDIENFSMFSGHLPKPFLPATLKKLLNMHLS